MVEAGRLRSPRLIVSARCCFGIWGAFNASETPCRPSDHSHLHRDALFFFGASRPPCPPNPDSPSSGLQARPGHGEPQRAAAAVAAPWPLFKLHRRRRRQRRVCVAPSRLSSIGLQPPTSDKSKSSSANFPKSHPHIWVDLRQWGLSFRRTGSLKGNGARREGTRGFIQTGTWTSNWWWWWWWWGRGWGGSSRSFVYRLAYWE